MPSPTTTQKTRCPDTDCVDATQIPTLLLLKKDRHFIELQIMLVILCRSTKKPFCASNASFQKSQEKLESHGGKVVPSCTPAASLQYAQNHYFGLLLPSKTNRRSTHSSKVNPNINFCKAPTAIARYLIPSFLLPWSPSGDIFTGSGPPQKV